MSIYIPIIALLVLMPMVIGIAYLARSKRRRVHGREHAGTAKNISPVTLDRNPDMPHRPGATS